MKYRVSWTVELDAKTPLDAAQEAREWQLDPTFEASCFDVTQLKDNKEFSVDVMEADENAVVEL